MTAYHRDDHPGMHQIPEFEYQPAISLMVAPMR